MKQSKKIKYLEKLDKQYQNVFNHHNTMIDNITGKLDSLSDEHFTVQSDLDRLHSGKKISMKNYPLYKRKNKKRINTCAK